MSLNSQQSRTSKSYKLTKSSKSSKSKCSIKLSKGDVMGKTDKSSSLKAKLTKGVKGKSSKSNSDGDDKGYNSALELSALNRVNLSNDGSRRLHHGGSILLTWAMTSGLVAVLSMSFFH